MWKFEIDGKAIACSEDPINLVESAEDLLASYLGLRNTGALSRDAWRYDHKYFWVTITHEHMEDKDEHNIVVRPIRKI